MNFAREGLGLNFYVQPETNVQTLQISDNLQINKQLEEFNPFQNEQGFNQPIYNSSGKMPLPQYLEEIASRDRFIAQIQKELRDLKNQSDYQVQTIELISKHNQNLLATNLAQTQ